MSEVQKLRKALADIAKVASAACGHSHVNDKSGTSWESGSHDEFPSCIPKALPERLTIQAAQTAMRINPVNAPAFGPMTGAAMDLDVADPLRIAVMVGKYWGPTPRQLTVSFMESTPPELRTRILSHMNVWGQSGCINFVWTQGVGQVRISRGGGGYWSYLGTDILHIPQDRQTMNLQDFTMNTPDSEYKRVVRHETGHTLGFPHEHMRRELVAKIDPNKAYDYFLRTQGWNRAMVDAQVLTPPGPEIHFRYGARPDVHHVLPASRFDHARRKTHHRRHGHQPDRRGLRGAHLSKAGSSRRDGRGGCRRECRIRPRRRLGRE
jgi:hypothetical protein